MDNRQEIKHDQVIGYEAIPERYVDIKKVSKYTSIPVKTIYDWSSQGKFPCIKFGRRILFDLHDIDKVMASSKRPYLQHEKTANKIIGDILDNSYNAPDSAIQAQSGFGKGGSNV